MAAKQVNVNATSTEKDTVQKVQGFWGKYSKHIVLIGSAIILVAAGYLGYKFLYKEPREQKARDLVFRAEKIFDKMANEGFTKESVNLALNGGTDTTGVKITGLLKIIKDYSGTGTANRAAYMIGTSYLHMQEFDKAIKYLKEFEGNGADQVQSKAYIMIGHAYAEQGKKEEAFDYYKKAANVNTKDEAMTPIALMTAAMYAETIGKPKDAIELYKKVKEEYPSSSLAESGEIDKYLARLGVTN